MIKTANLTANAETSITGLGGAHCRINNNTAGTLYASAKSGIVPGGDDVTAIPAGRGDYVVGAQGTVYLLSASGGSVQVEGTDVLNRPFDETAVASVAAVGNPVVMDNLQGGVPFSDMVISGKNLINNKITSGTNADVAITKNDDGSITLNGTTSSDLWLLLDDKCPIVKGKTYTFSSGLNSDMRILFGARSEDGTGSYLSTPISGLFIAPVTGFCRIRAFAAKGITLDNLTVYPQLELGDTATAYEPPITGQEITLSVSGKNLIPYPYYDGNSKTYNGITFTVNDDGSITANGTATSPYSIFTFSNNFKLKKGTYIINGCPKDGSDTTYNVQFANKDWSFVFVDYGRGGTIVNIDNDVELNYCRILISNGCTVENLVFRPQLELGSIATEYEKPVGSITAIVPDSNPYTVPDDIRQQDGLNVVTASAGTLEVVGVRKNAAIKKIWNKLDELTTAVIVSTADLSE